MGRPGSMVGEPLSLMMSDMGGWGLEAVESANLTVGTFGFEATVTDAVDDLDIVHAVDVGWKVEHGDSTSAGWVRGVDCADDSGAADSERYFGFHLLVLVETSWEYPFAHREGCWKISYERG